MYNKDKLFMDEDHKKDQFDVALPLPGGDSNQPTGSIPPVDDTLPTAENPAADLIRQRIEAAYASEPSIGVEAEEVEQLSPATKLSKHQQYINSLVNSGKSLADIQIAWHKYYEGLPDSEKHEVWQEFYKMHAQTSQYVASTGHVLPPQPTAQPPVASRLSKVIPRVLKPASQSLNALRSRAPEAPHVTVHKPPKHFQSLLFGLAAGASAVLIVLFSFFNERFIAPFIQPSRNVTNTPLIADASAVGSSPEVIIPKINVEIPVVYDVNTINETIIDNALENGVVHYADTALPGQDGNLVIVGHSSNNIFNKGKYKFAFVLLSRLENGDTFYLQKDGKRYTYQVYQKSIVKPNDVSVLGIKDKPATATLITCDPPGTSLNRLVVVGEQISPNPADNTSQSSQNVLATQSSLIPGNSESLWHRLTNWLGH